MVLAILMENLSQGSPCPELPWQSWPEGGCECHHSGARLVPLTPRDFHFALGLPRVCCLAHKPEEFYGSQK